MTTRRYREDAAEVSEQAAMDPSPPWPDPERTATELSRYIDEAKAALGDRQITGQPLAEAIAALVRENDDLRSENEQVDADCGWQSGDDFAPCDECRRCLNRRIVTLADKLTEAERAAEQLRVENEALVQRLDDTRHAFTDAREARAAKDGAYRERDQVVALAARMAAVLHWPTWLGLHEDKPGDPPWDVDWRHIVFIELPSGQVSWHIHDSELPLVRFLPSGLSSVAAPWDGHDTAEKYRRCEAPWPRSDPSQRAGDAGGRAETKPAVAPCEPKASDPVSASAGTLEGEIAETQAMIDAAGRLIADHAKRNGLTFIGREPARETNPSNEER